MSGVTSPIRDDRRWRNEACGGTLTWWSAASSDHEVWQNAAFKIDLAADNPRWLMLDPGSPQSAVTNAPLRTAWMDCRYRAARTYYTTQFISAAHATRDNVDARDAFHLVRLHTESTAARERSGGWTTGGWLPCRGQHTDSAGTWTDAPHYVQIPAVAKHPTTDDVYVTGGYYGDKVDRCDGDMADDRSCHAVDNAQASGLGRSCRHWWMRSRNEAGRVSPTGAPNYGPTIRLQFVDLATHAVSELPITERHH